MTCPPCTHDCNQGETCPAKSKKATSQLESQEPDVQETLHWYAFNYRQAHTAQAHEMWLELEKFVDRKMNTHSPQRTWVGLTNDELTDLFYNTNLGQASAVAQAIELLKERNT